jgi:hypothetical protein
MRGLEIGGGKCAEEEFRMLVREASRKKESRKQNTVPTFGYRAVGANAAIPREGTRQRTSRTKRSDDMNVIPLANENRLVGQGKREPVAYAAEGQHGRPVPGRFRVLRLLTATGSAPLRLQARAFRPA